MSTPPDNKKNTFEKPKTETYSGELHILQTEIQPDKTKVNVEYSPFYRNAHTLSPKFQKTLNYEEFIKVPELHERALTLSFTPTAEDLVYLEKIIHLKLIWLGTDIPSWLSKLKNIEALTLPNTQTLDGQRVPPCEYINGKKREFIPFEIFESQWLGKKEILFIGDSNMVGVTRNKDIPHTNVQAKGGRTTAEILRNLKILKQTKTVVILGGGNDIKQDIPIIETIHNIQSIIHTIHHHNSNIQILLGTITPRAQKSAIHAQKAQEINTAIREIVNQNTHIILMDWHEELSSNTNALAYNPAFVSQDLVHPSLEGYQKIRFRLDQELTKILER